MFSLVDGLAAVYEAQGLIILETWKEEAVKLNNVQRQKKGTGETK